MVDSGLAAAAHAETLQRTLSHLSLTNEEVHQVAHAAALQAVGAAAAATHHHVTAVPGASAAAAFGLGGMAAAAGAVWPAAALAVRVPRTEASLAFGHLGLGHHAAQLGPLAQAALAPGLASLDPSVLQAYQQSQQLASMQVRACMVWMPCTWARQIVSAHGLGGAHLLLPICARWPVSALGLVNLLALPPASPAPRPPLTWAGGHRRTTGHLDAPHVGAARAGCDASCHPRRAPRLPLVRRPRGRFAPLF